MKLRRGATCVSPLCRIEQGRRPLASQISVRIDRETM
jgi:hypothetical protein